MLSFLDVTIKFLYSFKKGLTFFYRVVENSDFAIAINFVLFNNSRDVDIGYFVEITIGMDRYFIVPDYCSLHHLHSYLCMRHWSYYWPGCRGY